MLTVPTTDVAARVRGLFRETGFTEAGLREALGTAAPPQPQKHNLGAFLHSTSEATPLNTLARWFLAAGTIPQTQVPASLSRWFLGFAEEHGLLLRRDAGWEATVLILPRGPRWIVADRFHWGDEPTPEDHVLAPGPSARALLSGIIPLPSRRTLDLGTGCGLLAFEAASRSERVVATDVNPRALNLAAFGARLGDLENIEFRLGSAYEPVAGESFDHIITNPPFVLSPRSTFIYRDNPMLLDAFVRELARNSVAHLTEGGFYQMVCEWAEVEGEPWPRRLEGWFDGAGCDAVVLHGMAQPPAAYALVRTRELALPTPRAEVEHFDEWMAHYREHRVVGIHGGMVTLRRREGASWMVIDEIPEDSDEDFGPGLRQTFAARDFLEGLASDEAFLTARLAPSPHLVIRIRHRPRGGAWTVEGIEALLENGLRHRTSLDGPALDFLRQFDGTRTLEEVADFMARTLSLDPVEARRQTLPRARSLIEHGFLLPA